MWLFWLEILALAVLGSYLIAKQCQRTRELARRLDEAGQRIGKAFDAGTVSPRINRLRQNYVAQLHSRPIRASHRREFVASVARALRQLPYFRQATAESSDSTHHESQTHGA